MKSLMTSPTETNKKTCLSILLCLLLLVGANLRAQLPNRPEPPRLVNDLAGILTRGQVDQLETLLVKYNDTTSTQIVVLTVNDLQGYDVAQYATKIGENWGVGQGDKNNGAVLLVKPKTGDSKGEVNISVGYGLEQYITDAAAHRIIEQEMIPSFKEGNYFSGILKGVQVMMDLCSGKFTPQQYTSNKGDALKGLILLGVIGLIIYLLARKGQSQSYSGSGTGSMWIPSSRGYRTGGFSGGGSHGGGFSGFGGGHFGGGGASGSW